MNPLPSKVQIEQKLLALFDGEEWDCKRILLRSIPEHNQFITANILVILSHCQIQNPRLHQAIEQAKFSLKQYQNGHQVYHWRFKGGFSMPDNAPFLNAFKLFKLDADADCTAFQCLALNDDSQINQVLNDLAFYRLDNARFRLPDFQRRALPDAMGSFLVWFPSRESCVSRKIEQLDIVVQAHILWLLSRFNRLESIGATETTAFLKSVLKQDLIIKNPYAVSPYYPFPLVILYALSRAIVWGKLESLYDARVYILSLARSLTPTNDLERLCSMSIEKFWGNSDFYLGFNSADFSSMRTGTFYAATNASKMFEWMSHQRWTRFEFHSEALQWAMLYWLLS